MPWGISLNGFFLWVSELRWYSETIWRVMELNESRPAQVRGPASLASQPRRGPESQSNTTGRGGTARKLRNRSGREKFFWELKNFLDLVFDFFWRVVVILIFFDLLSWFCWVAVFPEGNTVDGYGFWASFPNFLSNFFENVCDFVHLRPNFYENLFNYE